MKKYLIAILSIIFIFQIKSNVFGASYEELYLQAGQDTTVTVPYYGDSYSWDGTGESVIYASSDSSVAVAYNVGVFKRLSRRLHARQQSIPLTNHKKDVSSHLKIRNGLKSVKGHS